VLDACQANHFNLVKYLLEIKHCDINQLTTTYETCLHGAILGAIENRFDTAMSNQQRYHIVEYLLSRSDCQLNIGRISMFTMRLVRLYNRHDRIFLVEQLSSSSPFQVSIHFV
jgi:hypothetical protein